MLAMSSAPLSAAQFVRSADVGVKYIEQLLAMLKKGGIVTARRGKSGGYVLSRSADRITVLDMLSSLGDSFESPKCVDGACNETDCPNRGLSDMLEKEINGVFASVTLSQLCNSIGGTAEK